MKLYSRKNEVSGFYFPVGQGIFENHDQSKFEAVGIFRVAIILGDKLVPSDSYYCFPLEEMEDHMYQVSEVGIEKIRQSARSSQ